MPTVIYPSSIKADKDKLFACYSLIRQTIDEHNRQSAIAQANSEKYIKTGKFKTYQEKQFKPRIKQLLAEQNRLKEKIRLANYTLGQWKKVCELSFEEQKAIYESLFGDRTAEKVKPTLATSPVLDELKAFNLDNLEGILNSDPYEDFDTDYTEVDPATYLALTDTRVTYAALPRNVDAYTYRDKGAGHFSGDFEHKFTGVASAGITSGWVAWWALANLVDDWKGIDDANGDLLSISAAATHAVYTLNLYEMIAGTLYSDATANITINTIKYLTMERDEAVGTYGTLYCYIYSDATRETLWDTLTVTLHEKEDFRYIYAIQTYNDNYDYTESGYVENLDLQEGGAEYEIETTTNLSLAASLSRSLTLDRGTSSDLSLTSSLARIFGRIRATSTNLSLAISFTATEEQTTRSSEDALYAGFRIRTGQKLTISNREVTRLSFVLRKGGGNPTGNISFVIRKVSDDGIIASKVWGDASLLPGTGTFEEVILDSPVIINEEVRLLVEYNGGDASNWVGVWFQNTDVKADECRTYYLSSWTDSGTNDTAYIYTYQSAPSRIVAFTRAIAPNLNLAVTIGRVVTFARATLSNLSLMASISRVVTWTRASLSNLNLAINIVKSRARTIATSSALSLTTTVSRVTAWARAITSNLSLATTVSKIKGWIRTISSSLNLATSILVETAQEYLVTITANLSLATSVAKSWARTITTSTNLSLTTAVDKVMTFTRAMTSNLSLATNISRAITWARASLSSLSLAVTVSRAVTWARASSSNLSLAVSIAKSRARTIATSLGLTLITTIDRLIGFTRATSSNLNLITTISKIWAVTKAITTNLTLASTISRAINYTRATTSNLALTTILSRAVAYTRATVENLALTIAITIATKVVNYIRIISINLALTTNVSRAATYTRATTSGLRLIATIILKGIGYLITITTNLNLTATVSRSIGRIRTVSARLNLTTLITAIAWYCNPTRIPIAAMALKRVVISRLPFCRREEK